MIAQPPFAPCARYCRLMTWVDDLTKTAAERPLRWTERLNLSFGRRKIAKLERERVAEMEVPF